ncbi:MAG: glutamate--cysteine ligase [Gammaproteobacteria bacterium]|nr:glutamate--cysteine ligase [Gammaproteobacteria bacterium]
MSLEHIHAVPHLITALTGPLHDIETHLLQHQAEIESWFRHQWLETPAPFYGSVDLRNAGFKLAPVDTNLFPAGFNNLNPAFMPLCIQAVQAALERICPKAVRIVLIPENHTRNPFYLESLATLQEIITKAGFEIRIGTLNPELEEKQTLNLTSGKKILLEPVTRKDDKIFIDDFEPCLILLNNDLSSGRPAILENLKQMVLPPLELGWSNRLKSDHFSEYHGVAVEFCKLIDIDPWLITPMFCNCGEIDFMKKEGDQCLSSNVDRLLKDIQKKYDQYGIDKPPFVIVKADAGTYGMGIMTVHSADEVLELNRKQRTRMSTSKGGQAVTKVIIQEGVYTFETWGHDQAVAEPVVYMLDRFVVGGFYRVHTGRGVNENLNAPGMHFEPLAFVEPCNVPDCTRSPDADPNRFYAYGVIARLALLAAAREHEDYL